MGRVVQGRALPVEAARLCEALGAPLALVEHLERVHEAAVKITEGLGSRFPALAVDVEAVRLGAAIHDLGKARHLGELTGPGERHEIDGPAMLEAEGLAPSIARFARTHARWSEPGTAIEDRLVAWADKLWKGRRDEALEAALAEEVAAATGEPPWAVFAALDDVAQAASGQVAERV